MKGREIEFEYCLPEGAVEATNVLGGLQLSIDDTRVNAFQKEDSATFGQDWSPEYVGVYLQTDLHELINTAREISEGKFSMYECVKPSLRSTVLYFVLQPVAPQQIRVAFRTRKASDSSDWLLAAPKSARGYAVNRCSFCQAVSDVGHRYLNEISSRDLIGSKVLIEEFEDSLAELDEAIKDCEQTPPETC